MKRIFLMLALFLTLSFGTAFGTSTADLDRVDGLFNPTTIGLGSQVTFWIGFESQGVGVKVGGAGNGYQIYSPDGAGWNISDYGPIDKAGCLAIGIDWDLAYTVTEFSVNGSGADTLGFLGATMSGAGIPDGYSNTDVYHITVDIPMDVALDGKTICIDSAYFPPTGSWMWAYTGGINIPPDWGGPYCYTLYDVPDLNVVWVNPTGSGGGDHCDLVVIDYTVDDPDPAGEDDLPTTWQTSHGSLTGTGDFTAQFTYAPTLADVGASIVVTLGAHDAMHVGSFVETVLNLNFTNQAPTIACGDKIFIGQGNSGCISFSTDDVDCDPSNVTICGIDPTPAGNVYISGNSVCFDTDPTDGGAGNGIIYTVDLCISDGNDGTTCAVEFEVLTVEPFEVQIEKTHNTLQGMHVILDVTLNLGSEKMGGYDFMIAYDASALIFQAAIPGDYHTQCGWEYFNYRFGSNGNCGNACPSGMLEVIAIAETNNGPNHPTCLKLPLPAVLFSLDFLVSNDRTLECMYVPIRFFWTNCTDNSIAYHPADDSLSSVQGVSRFVIDFDLIGHIEDGTTGFPTYTGVQDECLVGGGQGKPAPNQFVDFLNGGVDIVCADSIDARGDINLNGTANEIADAVLFSNYFVKGIQVFNVDYQGQVAATDVNADGLTLSVADLVYLIRIIVGDANPYPKLGAEAASYRYENGVMSIDSKMGAAFVVIEGNVNPTLLATEMEMSYAYDGHNTRVLISKIDRVGFEGDFLQFDGRMVSVEFATYDGTPVAKQLVPTNYSLAQNYPNPFNGMTKIAFGMPTAGDYTLTIYNVTGQKVADFSGTSEAGMVTVDWDAANQASGVYFYKLDTENFTDTKKMVYLK